MDKTTNYFLIFIGLVVLGIVLKGLAFFLRPLILAVILTMLIAPSIKGIQKKRLPRIIKKNIVRLSLLILVALSIFFFIQATKGVQIDVDYYQNKVNEIIVEINDELISRYNNDFNLLNVINSKRTVEIMSSLIQRTIDFFSELALTLLFTILFLPSYNRIVDNLTKSLAVSKRDRFKKTLEKVEEGMVRYLGGKTIISLCTAITSALALFIFGANYIFIIAIFIFILNFIPDIGSVIAVLIAVLFYFAQYGLVLNVLWLLIVLIIIQIIWGSLIDPHFIGYSLRLYPFVVLASLFLWYWIWGPIGMLLAVPITSTIKIILENLGEKTKYVSKLLGD